MRISIAGKVCFVLLIIFSSVLIAITAYQAQRERELVLQVAHSQAKLLLQSYLDGAALMPTAAARQALGERLTQHSELVSLQLLPHDPAGASSSPATPSPAPHGYQVVERGADTRLVLMQSLEPGWFTACQECNLQHSGPQFIRLEYSLNAAFDDIETHLLTTALLLCLFFGAGLLLALYIIRRQIVGPLHRISLAMERASDLGDHSIRLPVERNDELGRLSENFNQLMESLASSPQSPPASGVSQS